MMSSLCAVVSVLVVVEVVALLSVTDAALFAKSPGNVHLRKNFRDSRRRSLEEPLENLGESLAEILSADGEFFEPTTHSPPGDDTNSNDDDVSETTPRTSSGQDRHKLVLMNMLRDRFWLTSDIEPPNAVIKFGIAINSVQYDNDTGIATTVVWEHMKWTDARLTWSPEEFGGIRTVRIPYYRTWQPDITHYDSITSYTTRANGNIVLSFDGSISSFPRAAYYSFCDANYLSRDVTCELKLGSWTYDEATVGLELHYGETPAAEETWSTEAITTSAFDKSCGATLISARARISRTQYDYESYPAYEAQIIFTPRGW